MHKPTVNEEAGMNLFSEAESISLIRLRYFQHQLNEMLKVSSLVRSLSISRLGMRLQLSAWI
jgi:hypothetical protein